MYIYEVPISRQRNVMLGDPCCGAAIATATQQTRATSTLYEPDRAPMQGIKHRAARVMPVCDVWESAFILIIAEAKEARGPMQPIAPVQALPFPCE